VPIINKKKILGLVGKVISPKLATGVAIITSLTGGAIAEESKPDLPPAPKGQALPSSPDITTPTDSKYWETFARTNPEFEEKLTEAAKKDEDPLPERQQQMIDGAFNSPNDDDVMDPAEMNLKFRKARICRDLSKGENSEEIGAQLGIRARHIYEDIAQHNPTAVPNNNTHTYSLDEDKRVFDEAGQRNQQHPEVMKALENKNSPKREGLINKGTTPETAKPASDHKAADLTGSLGGMHEGNAMDEAEHKIGNTPKGPKKDPKLKKELSSHL